ncbi:hypothetical protein [Verrucomicrobium spinosum]|uniref:hypothetical protein n=1 Tax=Verrucomicrobium spinosum TaxID=2736 RepID=UPI0009EC5C7A|nr:hypothetical protein [Verrucomicrobium spinosum]
MIGGISGGLGAYALIKSYHLVRGDDNKLHWSKEHFREQVKLALLSYLAVAHFGRGRGAWKRDPRPAHWQQEVSVIVEALKDKVDAVWMRSSKRDVGVSSLNEEMETLVVELGTVILAHLYPKATL